MVLGAYHYDIWDDIEAKFLDDPNMSTRFLDVKTTVLNEEYYSYMRSLHDYIE